MLIQPCWSTNQLFFKYKSHITMINQYFSVQLNQGVQWSDGNKLFHCLKIDSIPEIKPSHILYYIEIEIKDSHKSHFNGTLFHDVHVKILEDADCMWSYQKNGWRLEFLSMPRGRGVDKLKYKIIDPLDQEVMLFKLTDTRNLLEFCNRLCLILNQFNKASSLPNLNHHLFL